MNEVSSERLAAWVQTYVAATSRQENVDAFVAYVDDKILTQTPELADDPVLLADLHASTRAQFQVFLSLLKREKQELLLPPQAVDLALSIARRQLELGVLLKVYRVAAAAVWEFCTQVVADVPQDGPDRAEVLIYLWDHGGTWINEAIQRLIGVYYDEREAAVRGRQARRTETMHSILRGEQLSLDVASSDLGYPLRGLQTALVLWADEATSADALVALNELAAALAYAVNARSVIVPVGRGEHWCWLGTREPPDVPALREVVCAKTAAPLARVAVGTTAPGLEGFRVSHREAVDAQHYAVGLTEVARFTAYADVELACLVAGNEAGVRALIQRELGDLANAGGGLDRVRETIATYLELGANVDQTAISLMVHKNTIRYRLAQAEELIGHPLSQRRTELALALRCLVRYADTERR